MLFSRVVQVKVEVAEEQIVSGVNGERGGEIGEEVAKTGSWSWWDVDECSLDGCSSIHLQLEIEVFHGGVSSSVVVEQWIKSL